MTMSKKGPGRLTDARRAERDEFEEALALLWRAAKDLDETALRIEQAMRRSAAVQDVLRPALERVKEIRGRVQQSKRMLADHYAVRQAARWKEQDK